MLGWTTLTNGEMFIGATLSVHHSDIAGIAKVIALLRMGGGQGSSAMVPHKGSKVAISEGSSNKQTTELVKANKVLTSALEGQKLQIASLQARVDQSALSVAELKICQTEQGTVIGS